MSTRGNSRGGHTQVNSTYRATGGRGQRHGNGHRGDRRGGSRPDSGPGRGVSPAPSQSRFRARGRGRGDVGANVGNSFHTGTGSGSRGLRGSRSRGGYNSGTLIFRGGVPAQLPPLLEPEGLQQLVETFKDFKIMSPTRPLRPDYGTVGTEIKLRTNFFTVKLLKQPIYSYAVKITPQPGFNALKAHIFQLLEQNPAIAQHITYIAHDRCQTLISAVKLPQPLSVIVPLHGENQPMDLGSMSTPYVVSIVLVREFDPNELTR